MSPRLPAPADAIRPMHSNLHRRLIRQHPGLFVAMRDTAVTCPLGERGIESCAGWDGLLESLCIQLRRREMLGDPPIRFLHVKEKLGLLRIYFSRPASVAQVDLIQRAEVLSGEICWVCGAPCTPPSGVGRHDGACGLHGGAQVEPCAKSVDAMVDLARRYSRSRRDAIQAFGHWLLAAAPSFRIPLRAAPQTSGRSEFAFEGFPDLLRGCVLDDGSISVDAVRNGRTVDALLSTDLRQDIGPDHLAWMGRPQPEAISTDSGMHSGTVDFEILLRWVNTRLATAKYLGVLDSPADSTAAGLYGDLIDLREDLGEVAEVIELPGSMTDWWEPQDSPS